MGCAAIEHECPKEDKEEAEEDDEVRHTNLPLPLPLPLTLSETKNDRKNEGEFHSIAGIQGKKFGPAVHGDNVGRNIVVDGSLRAPARKHCRRTRGVGPVRQQVRVRKLQ
jgi:hypothetical protein